MNLSHMTLANLNINKSKKSMKLVKRVMSLVTPDLKAISARQWREIDPATLLLRWHNTFEGMRLQPKVLNTQNYNAEEKEEV